MKREWIITHTVNGRESRITIQGNNLGVHPVNIVAVDGVLMRFDGGKISVEVQEGE